VSLEDVAQEEVTEDNFHIFFKCRKIKSKNEIVEVKTELMYFYEREKEQMIEPRF